MSDTAYPSVNDLTLEEKASLTSGGDAWHLQGVETKGIPGYMITDGPHGLRKSLASSTGETDLNDSVPATCFPPAAGLSSSWNPELIHKVGEAMAEECIQEKVAVILGPGVNIKRNPLGGRCFEYWSEDPYLAGHEAVGIVAGVQSKGVGTSLKHFAANNQETDRLRVSANISQRALREIYFPAFEHIVKTAQPWTIMCSYNRINGVHSAQNRWLLTDVLRDEWGYEGIVMSDWGADHDRVAVHVLGGGVGDDIRTPFKRTAINGCGKGIVHNEGNAVRMGNIRHFTDIQHAKRGIGNSLRKESFRIGAERFGDFLRRSVLVHESNFNAHFPECDGKEVVCAPVNRRSTDDMIPSLANIENGKEGSRLAGRRQNGGHTALQFGNFSGNRLIGGVLEACIKESGFFQIKQFCHLFAGLVLERRALVNGQYAGFALFRRPARLHAQGLRSQFLIHHAGHAMRCLLPCKAGKTRRMDKFAPAPAEAHSRFFPSIKPLFPANQPQGQGRFTCARDTLRSNETAIPPIPLSRNQPFPGE